MLKVFEYVFPERYALLGLTDQIVPALQARWSHVHDRCDGVRVSIRAHKDTRSESTVVGPLRMEAGPVTALLQRESAEHGV